MKKYLIFTLLSLIFSTVHAERVYDIHPTKKIEANPINIAVMLMQENDTAGIASTLKYYGYIPDTSDSHNALRATHNAQDGYTVFTHKNGSTIRYKLNEQNNPTVEVTSNSSAKERDKILDNLNFQKNGNAYEQRSVGFTTRGTFAPHGTLILQRIAKQHEP